MANDAWKERARLIRGRDKLGRVLKAVADSYTESEISEVDFLKIMLEMPELTRAAISSVPNSEGDGAARGSIDYISTADALARNVADHIKSLSRLESGSALKALLETVEAIIADVPQISRP